MTNSHPASAKSIAELQAAQERVLEQLRQVVVGQTQVIDELLIALLAGGHCLLVGVPGLAKTLIVKSLADSLGLAFRRIQFTPDLMPADITGTEVIQEDRTSGQRELKFLPGPIFGNVVLADEINRTPPKTQAALLEAMQERQVTIGGEQHLLPSPFFVLATQNPIEQEGTYPLPEAQRDRFLFEVHVGYPAEDDEFEIVRRTTGRPGPAIEPVLDAARLLRLQETVRDIPAADHVIRYALTLARLTRKEHPDAPDFVREYVTWGAGPRASQSLVLGAKARAVLRGRDFAGLEDVQAVAVPVLRHRIITNFAADADGVTPDEIVRRLLAVVPPETRSAPLLQSVSDIVKPARQNHPG
ncbi:MAG: MoxR family ATPase [Planctomycetaceae bacterium]